MMKKIIYLILMVSMVGLISACSSSLKQEKIQLTEEINQIKADNEKLTSQVNELEKEKEDLDKEILELKEEIEGLKQGEGIANSEELIIYGGNIDTYEKEKIGEISVDQGSSLEEQLQLLADRLSEEVFGGLGIELWSIDTVHGKQLATINLTEKENNQDVTWNTMYFQGSAGGAITSVALSNTFLQKEYTGDWIDGVKFLYNEEDIDFQHVEGLSQANYR